MLPSETMIWQPEFTDKTLSRKPGAVHKHTYLGYETKDLVDVVTGDITTIQSLRHTSDLDTGEMYVFLCKVEAWAMNIGCHLTIPQSCEFQLLRDKQEA
ncbi:DLP12 prophage; DNA base-flipping protein [Escherichia coli]|nr:DLP12 prophage; DNA base-flipping protein [Escherichia coli]